MKLHDNLHVTEQGAADLAKLSQKELEARLLELGVLKSSTVKGRKAETKGVYEALKPYRAKQKTKSSDAD